MGERKAVWGSPWVRLGIAGTGTWLVVVLLAVGALLWRGSGEPEAGSMVLIDPGGLLTGICLPLLLLWLVVGVLAQADLASRQTAGSDGVRGAIEGSLGQLRATQSDLAAVLKSASEESLALTRRALDETLAAIRKTGDDTLTLTRQTLEETLAASRKADDEALSITRRTLEEALAAFSKAGEETQTVTRRTLEEALAALRKADEETLALTGESFAQALALTRKADEDALALTRQAFDETHAATRQTMEQMLALAAAQAESARQHAEFIAHQASLLQEQRDQRDRESRHRLAAARVERLAASIPSRLRHWKIFEGGLAPAERFGDEQVAEGNRYLFARLEDHIRGLAQRIRQHPMDVVLVEEPLSSLVELRAELVRVSRELPDDHLLLETLAADRLPGLIATIDDLIALTTANIETK